ncbi:MAG: hypothetical protein KDC57_20835 [Saprospiraceae bacterium]|nr:hypothetical protein [Saprospiraceae bacterium]
MNWRIINTKLETSWQISQGIPEFTLSYSLEAYQQRTWFVRYLNLVAFADEHPVAFKLGDTREHQVFYSWLGGCCRSIAIGASPGSLPKLRKPGCRGTVTGL